MAVKDVREYFVKMQNQFLEMKADLVDFEQAFKNGQITEDRLVDAKKDVDIIEANYERLLYIIRLLDMPNRKEKKAKYKKQFQKNFEDLVRKQADELSVAAENNAALDKLNADLTKLTEEK